MIPPNVRKVLAKELRETLRDRRTLLVMLVIPIFLYPVLLVVVEQLVIFGRRSMEQEPATVVVSGAPPAALAFLRRDSTLRLSTTDSLPLGAVHGGRVDAVVRYEQGGAPDASGRVRVFYDASRDRSRRAQSLLEERLDAWGDTLLAGRLRDRGLPASFVEPLEVADSSVATAERMGSYALGRFLPALLILMTLLGTFYPAIDLTAGEKERGTLETLLTTPVPAREVVAGKFLAVCAIGMAAATLNVVSMLLTFESGVFQFARAAEMELRIPLSSAGLVLLFVIPLAVFFSALFLGLAVRAQSFKEAQNALTPVQFATLIPIYLPLIPGIPLSYGVALVPVGGVAVLFRELMSGGAPAGPAAVAVAAMVVYALLALRFAADAFGREEVLFGSGSGRGESRGLGERIATWRARPAGVPRSTEALAFAAGIALLYFYLGVRLQIIALERGLLASQWLLLALPALIFAWVGPYRVRAALALRPPRPRALLAAVLVIAGGMPLGWALSWAQSLVLEVPPEYLRAFQNLLTADTPARFAWLLFLIAFTPAVCEELVFRGVLLQGLARDLPKWRAVGLSAVIFGAFHLSFETAVRFLPTAWLGLLLGVVVWHTRSIFAGMLMHFLSNATVLALISAEGAQGRITGPDGEPRWILVALGAGVLALGLRLLPARATEEDEAGEPLAVAPPLTHVQSEVT